ncbi:MAG: nucleotide exchange factor GrpE [Planctomycetes bacterium]|nr:nucleotide exchange factor GrpE [Planctomycetota bacterium]
MSEEKENPTNTKEPAPGSPEASSENPPAPDLKTELGAAEAAALTPSGGPALTPEEREALVKKAEERDLFFEELLRAKADFENYRKRQSRERASWESQSIRRLMLDLLPILDNFERALAENQGGSGDSLKAGIRLIYQMHQHLMERYHVREMEALNRPFDPERHEAVQQVEIEEAEKDGLVVKVLQKGYTCETAILRPAKVQVGKLASKAAPK